MRHRIFICVSVLILFQLKIFAQDSVVNRPNRIKSGFYLKLGVVFPVGKFAAGQVVPQGSGLKSTGGLQYLPAKIGGALDLGYLIYIGPSFAGKHLRLGIDATFLSFWINTTQPADSKNSYEHYYYFAGQKFGPVFTINPVDRFMIDLSWKLNPNFCYYYGEWGDLPGDSYSKFGGNLWQQEVSLGLRYRIILFSFQYNFGKMSYNDLSKSHNKQTITTDTFRVLFGLKF